MFSAAVSEFLADKYFAESIANNEKRVGGMTDWQKPYSELKDLYYKWRFSPKHRENIDDAMLTLTAFKEKTEALEGALLLSLTPAAKEYLDLMNRIDIEVTQTYSADSYAESNQYYVDFFDLITGNREGFGISGHSATPGVHLFRDLPKSFLSEEGLAKKAEFFDLFFGKKGIGGPSL